jgi:hypothetical protein
MKPLGIFFLAVGTVLLSFGILFHYKERKDYGAYFFFAGVSFFIGIGLS